MGSFTSEMDSFLLFERHEPVRSNISLKPSTGTCGVLVTAVHLALTFSLCSKNCHFVLPLCFPVHLTFVVSLSEICH
jgi:hypothetical protein